MWGLKCLGWFCVALSCYHFGSGGGDLGGHLVVDVLVRDERVDVAEVGEAGEVVVADLGVVGQQHTPAAGGDRGPLHHRLGRIGGGQAAFDGDAVGGDEGDVHERVPQ